MVIKKKLPFFKFKHGGSYPLGKLIRKPKTGGRLCPKCKGRGRYTAYWLGSRITTSCEVCNGKGYIV